MADTIEKIIKIEASGSEQTVKGLKKEIDSLRDALLNVEKGGDDYKKILEQLIGDQKQLADVMSAGKNEVSAATGSYNALKNEMSALKKVWAEVTDETSRNEIGKRIDEINTELKEMDASIGNFQRNVGNYASGFKNARQELAALKTQMDNLEEGSAEYNAAFSRAAEITHTLQERQEMLRYSAADLGTQLSNISGIAAGLMGGFNALQGVLALTGNKSEELQETMMKLQAGIAIVQGLQGLEGMTKKAQGLVEGLTNMIFSTNQATTAVAAETTAVGANTAAQEANTVATAGATVATKAFQKALVATGIGAIVVLIGTLIANWDDLKNMIGLSSEKLEQFGQFMDKAKAAIVGVANAIGNILITPIKNAITYISTLGNVIKDVFTLNFSQIGDHIKEGFSKIVDNVKKGYDVVGNYQEAYNKKSAQLSEERMQRAMKASAEELNEIIKDNEAKNGSDWKYTEEGKKMYDEYFKKKLAGYKEDSKEYREAQREMWAYNREYNKKIEDAAKETASARSRATKETRDTELDAIEKIKQRAADAQKTELQLLEEKYNEEKALLEKRKGDYEDYEKAITDLTAEYDKKRKEIEKREQQRANDILKRAEDAAKDELQILEEKYKEELKLLQENGKDTIALTKEYENKRNDILKKQKTEKATSAAAAALQKSDDNNWAQVSHIELEYSLKEAKNGSLSFNDLIEETNRIYEANKQHLQEQAAEYKKLMDDTEIDDETRLNAKRDYENALIEMDNLATQNQIDNTNLKREAINNEIQMYQQLGEAIADIFGSIADILEEDIKNKVKNGEMTQEEGEKQFEWVKGFQIAQATIQTISGAIAAFMGCQSLGQPWGAIIGAVQAAAVTAAGIAQIAKIKSTQLGSGGSSAPSAMAATAVQTQPEEYVAPYTQNATGESEIVNLANSIKDQKVYVVESDITEAQNRSKVRVTESTW